MDEIRLKNFRCFRDEQIARLAPTDAARGRKQHRQDFLYGHGSRVVGCCWLGQSAEFQRRAL